jgi:lipid II:glycine glycyltransferase (peptidoglycan interpeptide bridge formation enzyme)
MKRTLLLYTSCAYLSMIVWLYNVGMKLVEIADREAWDAWVDASVWGHPLQLWGWGETKRPGWTPHRLALVDGERWVAVAQVLLWRIPKLGRVIAYVPRGPVGEPGSAAVNELLDELTAWAREHKALYVRVEPAWREAKLPGDWVRAGDEIQMSATYAIDLHTSEDEILANMSHKHRQYARKAERDGIEIVRGTSGDLGPMMRIYAETAARAGFGIHPAEYYATLMRELGERNYLYYAKAEGEAVAFLWLAVAGATAYELYGGVNARGQELKANYVLKWQAIREMKAAGLRLYDFNGRVTEGVARFKEGFGPAETDWIGTWDRPLNRGLYVVWQTAWPMTKKIGRFAARRGSNQAVT